MRVRIFRFTAPVHIHRVGILRRAGIPRYADPDPAGGAREPAGPPIR